MSELFGNAGKGSKKNDRRFPGIRGKRPDLKALRQKEALERNTLYTALPLAAKVLRNPKKFAGPHLSPEMNKSTKEKP